MLDASLLADGAAMEELIKREYAYRGRVLNLRLDTVRVKDGEVTLREIA